MLKLRHSLTALLLVVSFAANAIPIYEVSIVDLPDGADFSPLNTAFGLNEHGQLVGWADFDGQDPQDPLRAFFWDAHSGIQDLGTLSGSNSIAFDINESGQVVGRSGGEAFIWDRVSGMQGLGILEGSARSAARAINDSGQVVGGTIGARNRAFVWDSQTGIQDLGALINDSYNSNAIDINNRGQVTGLVGPGQLFSDWADAYIWDPVEGVVLLEETLFTPLALNDAGNVAGHFVDEAAQQLRASIWNPTSGSITLLPDLANGGFGIFARDINNLGQAVGPVHGVGSDGTGRGAFIWDEVNSILNLNDLISPSDPYYGSVYFSDAYGINDRGQIAAFGSFATGNGSEVLRGFLLTPVPEPSTLALLGIGLAGMGLVRRRRTI